MLLCISTLMRFTKSHLSYLPDSRWYGWSVNGFREILKPWIYNHCFVFLICDSFRDNHVTRINTQRQTLPLQDRFYSCTIALRTERAIFLLKTAITGCWANFEICEEKRSRSDFLYLMWTKNRIGSFPLRVCPQNPSFTKAGCPALLLLELDAFLSQCPGKT